MSDATAVTIGDLTLTRVPYIDVLVGPEVVGLDADAIASVPWAEERWTEDGQVRVGACAWVVSRGDEHVVIDPFGNADDILHEPSSAEVHRDAITEAFAAAGIPVEAVTQVVRSHVEGIGMIVVRSGDGWEPLFPNARLRLPEAALVAIDAPQVPHWSDAVWVDLRDTGQIDTFVDGEVLVAGMVAQITGAHAPGHAVFHLGHGPEASSVGHLAVSPLHLSTGPCAAQHPEPDQAWRTLHDLADDERLLFGPLWPGTGLGRFVDGRFVAA